MRREFLSQKSRFYLYLSIFILLVSILYGHLLISQRSTPTPLGTENNNLYLKASPEVIADPFSDPSDVVENLNTLPDRENSWAAKLSFDQVISINQFVGASNKNLTVNEGPVSGKKVEHKGKYRHGVVLTKDENGNLVLREVGPNGIKIQ